MRLYYILSFLLLFAGGAAAQTYQTGPETVRALNQQYINLAIDCGSPSKPAFLCSGIFLRATDTSAAHHAWNPNPGGPVPDGVSFSWLRLDSNFHRVFASSHGFIMYPTQSGPAGKRHIPVLCSFPVDAYTWVRGGTGCGESTTYPIVSRACQSQGITTAEQWFRHFSEAPPGGATFYSAFVCGFDVRAELHEKTADAFYQSVRAMNLLGAEFFKNYNELMFEKWPQDVPKELAIEAFFYSGASGLAGAQYDQVDFKAATGDFVPVIKLTLPATFTDLARFEYIEADQQVQP